MPNTTPQPARQAHKPHGLSKEKSDTWDEAEKLDRSADDAEAAARDARDKADIVDSDAPLDVSSSKLTPAHQKQLFLEHEARYKSKAKEYRQKAAELRNSTQIESVIDDLGPKMYSKQATGAQSDTGLKGTVANPNTKKFVLGSIVGLAVIGGVYFFSTQSAKPKTESFPATTNQPVNEITQPASGIQPDGGYEMGGKFYYVVKSNIPAEDTGNEVCAKANKQCIGYTDLSVSTCLAFHPGAKTNSDLNGSKAGFYCNGAPQGGICAQETNTCHICPQCNLNMECDTVIGDFYRETYVECK